jgi:hypothetical protein
VCLIYRKAKVGRRKRDRYLISPIRSYNNPATAKSAPKSFDQPFHFARATTDGALQFCNYVFYKPPERERERERERDETLLFLSHTINFLKFFDDGAKAGKNMPFFSLPSLCICFFCVSRQNQSCVLQSTEKSKFGRKHVKREGSSTRRTDVASAIRTENLLLSFIELPAAMRKMPKQREKKIQNKTRNLIPNNPSPAHTEAGDGKVLATPKPGKCREKTIKTKPTKKNTVLYHTIALLTVQQ